MGFAALAATAIGSTVGALGSYEQGQAVANEAKYNAQVARNNAAYASAAGQTQATTASLKGAAQVGHTEAAQAANNIDVNSGSAVAVRQGMRGASVLNAATAQNNALLSAFGYQNQSALDTSEAQQGAQAGEIGAATDLLSGASQVSTKWAPLQSPDPLSVSVTPNQLSGLE